MYKWEKSEVFNFLELAVNQIQSATGTTCSELLINIKNDLLIK